MREIRALPDEAVKPLLDQLRDYYHGNVWERQIASDQKRLGADVFERLLREDMAAANPRREAALRLMATMTFSTEAQREDVMRDLGTVLGEEL